MKKSKSFLYKTIIAIFITFAISIIFSTFSTAYDIETYMVIHDNGQYLRAELQTKLSYLGKTVGYPKTTNDWENYVKKYPRIWCLAERETNEPNEYGCEIDGMIEIGTKNNDPASSRIYYRKIGSSNSNYVDVSGRSVHDVAGAAFVMKNGSNISITGTAQKYFYQTYKDNFKGDLSYFTNYYDEQSGDPSVYTTDTHNGITYGYYNPTYGFYNVDYRTQVENLCKTPINTNNYKNVKSEILTTPYNDKYYTKIFRESGTGNVINISPNSTLVFARTLTITYDDNGTSKNITYNIVIESPHWYLKDSSGNIKGQLYSASGEIYLTERLSVTNIKMDIKYSYIHSILYFLACTESQSRGISLGEWKDNGLFSSNIAVIPKNANVSLQKYIVGVGDKNLNRENITGRENRYAKRTSEKSISRSVSITNNTTKYSSKVEINRNQTVIYKIHVYNNTEATVPLVQVQDTLPSNAIKYRTSYTINNGVIGWNSWYDVPDDNKIIRDFNNLSTDNTWTFFYVQVQFADEAINNVENKAEIITPQYGSNANYRTVDYDYVKIKPSYEVNIKKYVSAVNDVKVTYNDKLDYDNNKVINDADAEFLLKCSAGTKVLPQGKIGDLNGDGSISTADVIIVQDLVKAGTNKDITRSFMNYNAKNLNFVEVTKGDEVTYTIEVTNNSNVPLAGIAVGDIVPLDLKIIEYVTDNGTRNDSPTGGGGAHYYLTLDHGSRYSSGQTRTYTVTVKAEKDNVMLKNTAQITTIEDELNIQIYANKNTISGVTIAGNFEDSDWIKAMQYGVSIKKYVSKVNGTTITNSRSNMTQTQKANNPYAVKVGDEVTYTIDVTNNSAVPLYIQVKDFLPEGVELIQATYDNKAITIDKKTGEIYLGTGLGHGSTWMTRTYQVKVKVTGNNANTNSIINTAEIATIWNEKYDSTQNQYVRGTIIYQNGNNTTAAKVAGNHKDSDYIKIAYYEVSIKKYVSKVNETTITNNRSNMTQTQKSNNPYAVKVGDEVTYTIEVTNNSAVPIYIAVRDYMPNGVALVNVKDGNGAIIDTSERTSDHSVAVSGGRGYPAKGNQWSDATYFVTVRVTGENATTDILQNTAKITTIWNEVYDSTQNKYTSGSAIYRENSGSVSGVTVTGTFEDSDWIKVLHYEVSIKKYVSKVNTTTISNRATLTKTQKEATPYEVKFGDEITYTIEVTNKSNVPLTRILVGDNVPKEYLHVVKCNNDLGEKTDNFEYTKDGTHYYLTLDHGLNYDIGQTRTYTVTVKVLKDAVKIENKAYITKMTNHNNDLIYENYEYKDKGSLASRSDSGVVKGTLEDSDYIKIKPIELSIKKYVSAVNGEQLLYNNKLDYNENGIIDNADSRHILWFLRGYEDKVEGKIYDLNGDGDVTEADAQEILNLIVSGYSDSVTRDFMNYNAKNSNPVDVKIGDRVTYKIIVENKSGESFYVKVRDSLPEGVSLVSVKGKDYDGNLIDCKYSTYGNTILLDWNDTAIGQRSLEEQNNKRI